MRPIDADALIKYCDDKWIPLNVDAVNAQPTIEPERKKGKWVWYGSDVACPWICSECDSCSADRTDYCPMCGSYNGGDQK